MQFPLHCLLYYSHEIEPVPAILKIKSSEVCSP